MMYMKKELLARMHMYMLYVCVYICVCMYVYGHVT